MNILVETSARHLHLSREHLNILFGNKYKLTIKKMLSQPNQFLSNEKIKVVGKKNSFNISVLGPIREYTQVELSLTDARNIGIIAPIRESGDIIDSGSCILIGPNGEFKLKNGVIIAKRHIHMSIKDANKIKIKNKDIVKLKINSQNNRSLIFDDVVIRVNSVYTTLAHIDTDESNAVGSSGKCYGKIII